LSEALAVFATCWGVVMSLAPLLQVRIIVRERDASGTSLAWPLILLIGFVVWFAYGVVNHNIPLVVSNAVAVFTTTTLLITALMYRRAAPAINSSR
jgi:MtN3 and saliva related transmembrane protein